MASSLSSSSRPQPGTRQRAASYAHGTSPVPLLGETLADVLDRHAHNRPMDMAVIACHEKRQLTFGELHDAATRVACGLIASGVRPGDRLALWTANSAEWIISLFAAAKIGAPCVGINPAFRAHELERVLTDAQVTTLILSEHFNDNDCADVLAELAPEVRRPGAAVTARRLPALRRVVNLESDSTLGGVAWAELMREPSQEQLVELEVRQAACDIDDCALILYTSGTGGRCKGVSHSHHAVVNGGHFVGVHLGYSSAERVCVPVPLFHVFGLVAGAVGALTHGATVVLPSPMFDASRCLDALQRYQCSVLFGVPTMLAAILDHSARVTFDVSSLRTGVVSGAACPAPLMRRAIEELSIPGLTVGYGMTEIGPVLYSAPGDSTEQRTRITGRIQGHMQCKIVDPASGRTVPRGERGELLSKGYGLMQGYIGDHADAPGPVDRAGWIRTGDLAVMSETGEVTIVGRLKDLIIRGGENIAPGEIEEVLAAHPAVVEAHVVGVPDERYGDEVCATVRLRDGDGVSATELKRFCRERLATYKVPRYFRFAVDFPRTSTGKVQKAVLRDLAIAHFKLEPRPAVDAVR